MPIPNTVGNRKNSWQNTESVLRYFGKQNYSVRKKYRVFVENGVGLGRNPKLTGGLLIHYQV